jgi:transcriptional regulator with XRE-family HTH domain
MQRARSKLAEVRLRRRVTQQQLSEVTGIPLSTYRKLERRTLKPQSKPLSLYVNCAMALNVSLREVLDEDDTEWTVLDAQASQRPDLGWWERKKG